MSKFLDLFELTTTMALSLPPVTPTILGKKRGEDEEEEGKGKLTESCSDCTKMSVRDIRRALKIIDDQLHYMADTDTYWGSTAWKNLNKRKKHLQNELDSRGETKKSSDPAMFDGAFA